MQSSSETVARIQEVISHWRTPAELASFAAARHGFGDSNGGFGVIYPGDLDEYQREIENACIPEGQVEIYGYWALPGGYEFQVSERFYLSVLAGHLKTIGLSNGANDVSALAGSLPNP
ncbi:hypothetical protein [Acidovorax sp. LjRoot117]|uniref:hypothetical protein n=1 Tax=Acidovorax sp. LjRoot117 TaxID=3342255 RepID=UPI003ECF3693